MAKRKKFKKQIPNCVRIYKCNNCESEQEHETNHIKEFVWPCPYCSDSGKGECFAIPSAFGDKCLRKFTYVSELNLTVLTT